MGKIKDQVLGGCECEEGCDLCEIFSEPIEVVITNPTPDVEKITYCNEGTDTHWIKVCIYTFTPEGVATETIISETDTGIACSEIPPDYEKFTRTLCDEDGNEWVVCSFIDVTNPTDPLVTYHYPPGATEPVAGEPAVELSACEDCPAGLPTTCARVFTPPVVVYDNSNGGGAGASVVPGTLGRTRVGNITSWIVDGANVLTAPAPFGPFASYGAQLNALAAFATANDPNGCTFAQAIDGPPFEKGHYRHIQCTIECGKPLPVYGDITFETDRGPYTLSPGFCEAVEIGCFDKVVSGCIEDDNLTVTLLDGDGNKFTVPEGACVQDCAKPLPENPEPSIVCTSQVFTLCATDEAGDDECVVVEKITCIDQNTGEQTTYTAIYTESSYAAYLASGDPDDLVEVDLDTVELSFCTDCGDCAFERVETLCDATTCTRVDFLIYNCNGEIVRDGPFVAGTDIAYEGKGPFTECQPKNTIETDCVKVKTFAYSWDNGSFSDPFTGIRLTPIGGGVAGTNGYNSAYDTPGGEVLTFNGSAPTSYVGFIDRYLKCGTATLDEIWVDGVNILPAPIVETATNGTWGPLNTLLWNTISSLSGQSFPSGIACHNNRPEIRPVNCWGQSISCADVNLEKFKVTDCRGNVWEFGFKKVELDEKQYIQHIYEDCNGEIQCEFIDKETKEIVEDLDPSCFVPCECDECGDEGTGNDCTVSYDIKCTKPLEYTGSLAGYRWNTEGNAINGTPNGFEDTDLSDVWTGTDANGLPAHPNPHDDQFSLTPPNISMTESAVIVGEDPDQYMIEGYVIVPAATNMVTLQGYGGGYG